MVPAATNGLYDSRFEHDACGVGFVADLRAGGGHDVVASALRVLCNLEHRGAAGADPDTGDGAGILTQIPDAFFRAVTGLALPEAGGYAAGLAFLPVDPEERERALAQIADLAADEGLTVLGWRDVPINEAACGAGALEALPRIAQLFVAGEAGESGLVLDRMVFCLRKRAEHETGAYFASLSTRTIVYKGMLSAPQVEPFFPDLSDERYASNLALVHSRFSTNTFPSWPRSHPYRYVAHNGEINTVQGNRNWMRAREAMLASPLIPESKSGKGIERLFPIIDPDGSDSGSFDECLELLHLGGRSLPHALLMMIPEPWENHEEMDARRRAFYQFQAALIEPWDGPALIAFTDGSVIGAVLDRNGLRPGRYWVTADGLVILASEVGVLDIEPARVVRRGRLQPGRIFLADTAAGRLVEDEEVKSALAAEHPYQDWLHAGLVHLDDLPDRERVVPTAANLLTRQRTFGYTEEELRLILGPMARAGAEPIGSMGTDTPVAVLSDRPRLVFDYFSQLFAQVTNPPLDAIREELVTSLATNIGPERNLLDPGPASCRQVTLPFPVIGEQDLAKLVHINDDGNMPGLATHVVDGRFGPAGASAVEMGESLRARLTEICVEVDRAIERGARLIILSDRGPEHDKLIPIPSLVLTGAVHHHLIREKTRTKVGLIVESGDARETHHVALLVGYGAAAICPYLAIDTVRDLAAAGELVSATAQPITPDRAEKNLIRALGKGLLKVMSKMGVSTVASYTGAQIFEAIGLGDEVIGTCFAGTSSRLGGVGFSVLAEEAARRAAVAGADFAAGLSHRRLETGGEYQWRREGEPHLFSPETVFKLQHATRSRRYEIFKEYTSLIDDQSAKLKTLRGLLRVKGIDEPGEGESAARVPIDDVEPVASIVQRFATGAMSYGSISAEAHETLAIAMNRLGGRSNTGEGGEDPDRFSPDPNGDLRRSAVKQVASGRFGVTSEYLVNADDLQIKMAQGAKPGEGGQLPGHKVYPWIAKTRYSTPGVGLISPPPHHDIYSIEDLAQLIHDLKNANPAARVHLKLVAEVGVGTV
ncbi:MAG: glutamate synthase large chain, partial [Trebonia sp.]|nr:glutamate synthase large chain [Trebonia sp.]